jgi:ABC-type glycerol-3-phosphate transport system permease component
MGVNRGLRTSIKPPGDTQTIPPKWLFVPTFKHYAAVFGGQTSSSQAFLALLWHSAVVPVYSTALAIPVGPQGYGGALAALSLIYRWTVYRYTIE